MMIFTIPLLALSLSHWAARALYLRVRRWFKVALVALLAAFAALFYALLSSSTFKVTGSSYMGVSLGHYHLLGTSSRLSVGLGVLVSCDVLRLYDCPQAPCKLHRCSQG